MITTIPYPYKLNKRHPIARGLVGFGLLMRKMVVEHLMLLVITIMEH